MGLSSLPPSLRGGIRRFFDKMKCIFSIALVEILEKSRVRNTHRTLVVEAPNVEPTRPVYCGAWLG